MKLKVAKSPFSFALILSILLFVLIKSLTVSSFETNDDALFMMLSSGFYTGDPYEYLIATPVITGLCLKSLYDHFSGVSWYGWYLLLFHFTAYVGIFYAVTKNLRNNQILILVSFILLVFESYFLAYAQFTTTGFLCGISGCFLILSTFLNRKSWPSIAFGMILILSSLIIRPVIFSFLMMLFLPSMVYVFYTNKQKQLFYVVVLLVGGFFALESFDSNYKGTFSTWKQYKNYFNHEFHGLADAPNLQFEKPLATILQKIGWTKNDFEMLKAGFFEDKSVYSETKIKILFSEYHNTYGYFKFLQTETLIKIILTFKYQFGLTLLVLIYCIFSQSILKRLFLVFTVLLYVSLVFYMGTFTILKSRILVPGAMILTMVSILLYKDDLAKLVSKKYVSIFISVLSSLFIYKIYVNSEENIKPRISDYKNEFNRLSRAFNGKVLTIWQTSLPFDNINIIENLYSKNSPIRFYYLDWLSGFPAQDTLLAKYNQKDIYHALLSNDFLLVIDNSHLERLTLLTTYYKEKMNLDVAPVKINFAIPEEEILSFSIYSFRVED